MAYAPQTWTNDDPATPLSAARLTVMETGIEDADNRATSLERGVATPQTITYASSITPDASAGSLFVCVATGNLTLNDPTGATTGQVVTVRIQASGADRTLSFAGGGATAVVITSGQWYLGRLHYLGSNQWLVED